MAKYLVQASYTQTGVQGLLKEGGSKRAEALEAAAKSLGGKLESLYFAFGETDIYLIFDLPDNVSAASLSFVANVAGTATAKVTVLLTPEEIDKAVKKTVTYRAPGK
jgi:uncharacterized protein with GYD domain